jgi:hypothetical protein
MCMFSNGMMETGSTAERELCRRLLITVARARVDGHERDHASRSEMHLSRPKVARRGDVRLIDVCAVVAMASFSELKRSATTVVARFCKGGHVCSRIAKKTRNETKLGSSRAWPGLPFRSSAERSSDCARRT